MTNNAVYIINTASFLPNKPIENNQMEQVLGQVGSKPSRARRTILRSNGIKTRHYAIDPTTGQFNYTNAELTAQAIKQLENKHFSLDDLDVLSCGTSIPDQLMPNHAVMVQGELKLKPCEVVATAGVCLAGVTALKYSYNAIKAGEATQAIASGSERASAMMQADQFTPEINHKVNDLDTRPELAFEKDFIRWMLSDGAGAWHLSNQSSSSNGTQLRIDFIDIISYAGEEDVCMYAGGVKDDDGQLIPWSELSPKQRDELSAFSIKQDVKLLNEKIVHCTVEKPLSEIAKKRQLKASDFDYFLPHYSSHYFKDRLLAGLQKIDFEIPQEKWFTNLYSKGNTGSASIFIMLNEFLQQTTLKPGQRILCYVPESGRFSSGFISLTVV